MKKMSMVCMTALCLTTQDISASMRYWIDSCLDNYSEAWAELVREEFKDAAKLRKNFDEGLLGNPPERMTEFKRKFGVSDEPMLTVLMDIIREATKAGGTWKGVAWDETRQDVAIATWRMEKAIPWLGICADTKAKQLLLGIATGKTNWELSRIYAVQAYLRRADAQEIRDGIARLLADDVRTTDMTGLVVSDRVYGYALQAHAEAGDDVQKREAIVASLSAALVKEEDKEIFVGIDKRLAELSKTYADSPQRKAALERLNIPAEKGGQ